jgi:F-type H+-transporting ATPase subunit gamma
MQNTLKTKNLQTKNTMMTPANVDGLGRLAGQLVARVEAVRAAAGGDVAVSLTYMRRDGRGRHGPVTEPLLPLDAALLDDLARRPWTSRSLPEPAGPVPDLLATLVRALLFATLHRAAAEAMVTENAARLARMQQAERAAEDRLAALRGEARQMRQAEITTELLDVITGFEALGRRPAAGQPEADE